jgi:hypothetical protein
MTAHMGGRITVPRPTILPDMGGLPMGSHPAFELIHYHRLMTKSWRMSRAWRRARVLFVVFSIGTVSLVVVGLVVSWQEAEARRRDTFDTVFERSVLSVSEVLGEPDLSESGDLAWHEGPVVSDWWDRSCDTRGPVRWPLDEVHLLRVLRRMDSIAASETSWGGLLSRETQGSISSDTTAVFGVTSHVYVTIERTGHRRSTIV